MRKRIEINTIAVGLFWLLLTGFWVMTLIVWCLWELGLVHKNEIVYGFFVFGDLLVWISFLELTILLLTLVVYFFIRNESAKKEWRKIAAIIISFTFIPMVPFYGNMLILFVLDTL